jgi:hypothetical protein
MLSVAELSAEMAFIDQKKQELSTKLNTVQTNINNNNIKQAEVSAELIRLNNVL